MTFLLILWLVASSVIGLAPLSALPEVTRNPIRDIRAWLAGRWAQ